MLSNEVQALAVGDSCEALLLTAKGRLIAPMTVFRRGQDDFLLLTEPELGEVLPAQLLRSRFAAKAEIALEEHESVLVVGGEAPPGGVPNRDYGVPAYELIDDEPPGWAEITDEELERLRIRARTPRFGRELDERVLPAEAGLDERAISFTKGCYPGQEPVARLHYRGHANRGLRLLALEGDEPPPDGAEVTLDEQSVGRVTSVARRSRGRPRRAGLHSPRSGGGRGALGDRGSRREAATLGHPAPVAQGIERCPAEAEAASSNLAGRMSAGSPWFPRGPRSAFLTRSEDRTVPLYLSESDVASLLTPADAVPVLEACFLRLASGEAVNEPRKRLPLPDGYFAVMAATDAELGYAGLKSYTLVDGGLAFVVCLFSLDDGSLAAVIEADRLGQLRTGAASGVAARHLARDGASSIGLIGCGWQAESQLAAIRSAVPTLDRAVAWCRTPDRLARFCEKTAAEPAESAQDAAACDVVVTATTAKDPVLRGEWLAEGALVCAIGANDPSARELDNRVLERASFVCCDSIDAGNARVRRPDRADRDRDARLAGGA